MRAIFSTLTFIVVLTVFQNGYGGTDPNCEYPNVLILLDKSGSMDDSISGGRKWDIAYNAVNSILNNFSNNIRFGLALFPWTGSCSVGQVLVNVGDNTASQILSTIQQNEPNGATPLASSLYNMNKY